MRSILSVISSLLLVSCTVSKMPAQQGLPVVYALSSKALAQNKKAVEAGDENLQAAYKKLLKDADKALAFGPVSVIEKKNDPPSGDKHDYMSLAPYFWPNPATKDGLPYIRKDGQTNPEVKEYKDKEYLPKLCNYVKDLGLAYYFSGDEKYATHAAKLMRVWFLDAATRMNPNLNYGQAIKGTNDGRGAGLIDIRHFVNMIDGIGLISNSKAWTAADQKGMQQWFTDFLQWMQTSRVGTDEMKAKNNHGAWYDAERLAMALYTGNMPLAKEVVQSAASRLDKQMLEDGSFPAEMERTISLHYTAFALEAFYKIAQMSEQTGFDFWNMKTPSGKSLQKAFETVKPFLANPSLWTGQQIKPFETEDAYPLLAASAVHYNCKDCIQIMKNTAGEKAGTLRELLTY